MPSGENQSPDGLSWEDQEKARKFVGADKDLKDVEDHLHPDVQKARIDANQAFEKSLGHQELKSEAERAEIAFQTKKLVADDVTVERATKRSEAQSHYHEHEAEYKSQAAKEAAERGIDVNYDSGEAEPGDK